MRWILAMVMMVAVAPVFASDAVQMWACEMDDDATEEQVQAMAAEWLEAAKKVKGGENFEAFVLFPIAVNATNEMDVMFVVTAPSFEEWGRFWDNYEGSKAAELETNHEEAVVCPDSVLWESFEVK
jgi:hypothetical protein